jgi:malonyl-CoA O-methyltransferase
MTLPSRIPGPPAALANPSLLPPDDAAEGQACLEQRGSEPDGLVNVQGRLMRGGLRILPQLAAPALPAFSDRVRQGFGRGAASYEVQARLQQAVAWRLGRLCRDLPLPSGPCADLGAGSGLLSRALLAQRPSLAKPPLQLDLCPELLARNPFAAAATAPWDLNRGLPPQLQDAGLLLSSFALQWLDDPMSQLAHWAGRLAPGGWLALAVPVAGSFDSWQAAARAASVPCTALPLPDADGLIEAAIRAGLDLRQAQRLRFSRAPRDGLATLRLLRSLGATASRQPPLDAGQLRRLLAHWPAAPLRWEVLVLVGRKTGGAPSLPAAPSPPGDRPC